MVRRLLLVTMLGLTGLAGGASAQAQPDRSETAEDKERATNAATVKRVLARLVARELPGHDARHLDVSVVSLTIDPLGEQIVVAAEVRIAVSGGRGSLLQVLAGGAKVEIPARMYRAHRLPALREDALTGAVEAVFGRVKRTLTTRDVSVAAR